MWCLTEFCLIFGFKIHIFSYFLSSLINLLRIYLEISLTVENQMNKNEGATTGISFNKNIKFMANFGKWSFCVFI